MHPSSNVPNAKVSVVQSVNIPSFICQFGAVLSTYRAAPEQENVMGHVKKQLQAALCRILAALPELHEQFGQLWAAPWCRRNAIELFHDRWGELMWSCSQIKYGSAELLSAAWGRQIRPNALWGFCGKSKHVSHF